jgi:hypothetical protein
MGQSEWGSAGPVQIHGSQSYDPMQGHDTSFTFRGSEYDLQLVADAYIAIGWQVNLETTNTQWDILHVKIPNQNLEDYIDRWEFNIGFKQQELFLNIGICQALNTAGFTSSEITNMKTTLENDLEAPVSNASVVATFTSLYGSAQGAAAGQIYQMLQMGQSTVEISQPTISRKRTYSYNFTGTVMSTQVTQDVWSTAALIAAFGIPAQVYDQITPDPTVNAVDNYKYGWKMRKNNLVIIPAKNKIEEQLEWEWDQWNTICYNYIT